MAMQVETDGPLAIPCHPWRTAASLRRPRLNKDGMDYDVIGQHQRRSDKLYKEVFVDFIKSREWHWFITIPIGLCDNDDMVLKRLRAIEAGFCGKYLVNRYQKLPDEVRFSMVVSFEGDARRGNRNSPRMPEGPSLKRFLSKT